MMRTLRILAFFLLLATGTHPVAAQAGLEPAVSSPRPGEVLQGTVTVTGSTDLAGFSSSEVSFAYANDPTGTWFLIAASTFPVAEAALAAWDTTLITDGTYRLRVRVTTLDGSVYESTVTNLRVRNYTPVETPTPLPGAPEPTAVPPPTPTATPYPTPTALPRNPAALTPGDVTRSLVYGGATAITIFLIFGLYSLLRRK